MTALIGRTLRSSHGADWPTVGVRSRRRPQRLIPWLGIMGIAGASLWLGIIGLSTLIGASDLSATLSLARGRMVGPGLIAAIVAVGIAEQCWPAVRRPLFSRAQVVDFGYFLLFAIVVVPLLTIVETGFGVEIARHAHFLMLDQLPVVPRVLLIGVILVGIDGSNWACHVANHRFVTLWRLHALHHSQEEMSVFTTFRTHPLIHATYLPALLPVLVLGASGTVPGAALIVYGCLVTLPHANLRWAFGPLGRVFVSPAYHRTHHAKAVIDPRGAVNFGFVLVIWDRLAGRAVFPVTGAEPIETGIADRSVPIEQLASRRVVSVVGSQLVQPFRPWAATDGPV